jgi:hypothetical protein
MYYLVESWKAKPAFLALSREEREAFFAAVGSAIDSLSGLGVQTIGWGRADTDRQHDTSSEWFAIWHAPDAELGTVFLDGVQASGWYNYFEQTNIRGRLGSVTEAIEQHVQL